MGCATNRDIREAIKLSGYKNWQIAELYGKSEGNFSRMLRRELPSDVKQRILELIEISKRR